MYLLGIDVGTTGAKACVFDPEGKNVGEEYSEYNINFPRPGYAEQDAEEAWNITKQVIHKAVNGYGREIIALCASVQGDAIIPVAKSGKALSVAQLGMDYRGRQEAILCEHNPGARYLFKLTGMRPHPLNSFIKMLYVKKNDPELYSRCYKFVTYSDFIMAKLGSEGFFIDQTMASRSMCMDLQTLQWSTEVLSLFEFQPDKLSLPVPSGTVVGTISPSLACELGINPSCKIVAGGHDQACAALGAGIIHSGLALDSHGTAEVISTAISIPNTDDIMFNSYYPCYAHTVPGMYFTFALIHTGGILLKWFVENFCGDDIREANEKGIRPYAMIDEKMSLDPSPVTVIPYMNGSGTPACDFDARGSFLGLTLTTTRADINKAISEALCFETRLNIETMRKTDICINELFCVGGGARSPFCLQLKADVIGIPYHTLQTREAACLGAAILAGLGANVYDDVSQAAIALSRVKDTYYPDERRHILYDEKYAHYLELANDVKYAY